MSVLRKPHIYWLTGLSGSGKSTIAEALRDRLTHSGEPCLVLDGDVLRSGLCSDLSYSNIDRTESVRRAAEVANIAANHGIRAIVALISPLATQRDLARTILHTHRMAEIYISTPLSVCEARDPKGLYKRARSGKIVHFTGLDAPYQAPTSPDLVLNTESMTANQAVEVILAHFSESTSGLGKAI